LGDSRNESFFFNSLATSLAERRFDLFDFELFVLSFEVLRELVAVVVFDDSGLLTFCRGLSSTKSCMLLLVWRLLDLDDDCGSSRDDETSSRGVSSVEAAAVSSGILMLLFGVTSPLKVN
jgi:hypothetical protein